MDVPAVSTENLSRRFGQLVAVENVNLRVSSGQFFGFLGPNGAGKSTTIKMLTGLLAPSAGTIHVLGLDLLKNTVEVKRQIGVVPEGMALFTRLTGWEYLNFVGRMYGLDRTNYAQPRRRNCLILCDWRTNPTSSSPTTPTACRRSWLWPLP
jgi:ABC-2 type transport system ATP-binding protein